VGGEKAGTPCTADANCAGNTYACTSGACVGGPNDTGTCTVGTVAADCNSGVNGVCGTVVSGSVKGACVGGLKDGDLCLVANDCADTEDGDTVSITRSGSPAVSVTVGTDVGCFAGGICVSGDNAGGACTTGGDCTLANGTCDRHCINGDNDGTVCSSDSTCTNGGTCQTGATCSDGPHAGTSCTLVSGTECNAVPGTCTGLESDDWIHATFSGSTVSISADANTGGARTGNVKAFDKTIEVQQAGDTDAPTGVAVTLVENYGALCVGGPRNGLSCVKGVSSDCPGTLSHCDGGTWSVDTVNSPGNGDSAPSFSVAATGATEYCIINDNSDAEDACPGDWTAHNFASALSVSNWALTTGTTKRIKVWVRDDSGNVTAATPLVFSLDSTTPAIATAVNYTVASNSIKIGATGAADLSGVVRLKVARTIDTNAAPSSCSGGAFAEYGGLVAVEDPNLPAVQNGHSYQYCVCRIDRAGHVSAPKCTTTGSIPKTDTVAPTGTVAFSKAGYNAGNSSTAGFKVTASHDDKLVAADGLGMAIPDVCISSTALLADNNCPSTAGSGVIDNGWVSGMDSADAAEVVDLATLPGTPTKTLYYKFRDNATDGAGSPVSMPNISALGTATTLLDTTAPVSGAVTTTNLDAFDVRLTLAASNDGSGSGVASIAIRFSTSVPTSCSTGTGLGFCSGGTAGANTGAICDASADCTNSGTCNLAWPINTTTVLDNTPSAATGTRAYRVCATDAAGTQNTGVVSGVINLKGDSVAPVFPSGVVFTVAPTCDTAHGCYQKTVSGVVTKWNEARPSPVSAVKPEIKISSMTDAYLVSGSARAQVCFSTTSAISGCTTSDWIPVTGTPTGVAGTTQTLTNQIYTPVDALAVGSATRSYYLFVKDPFGNVSTAYKKIDVKVDTLAPTLGALTPSKPSSGTVKLTWAAASDGSAGVGVTTSAPYVLKFLKGTTSAAPTGALTCTSGGTAITLTTNTPTTATVTKSGLSNAMYYKFILCAKDFLGAQSSKVITYRIP
jgi:hypothetical protein